MSMIGKTLGHYTVSTLIGRGGMGEVYKAKDQKLGRDVAIKVLPEEFAKDIDRIARFQREAKLLASLNHPNIAAIHGLEESDGTHFLVLELIEGDTLADRLKGGAIPVEESLKIALQIAEALEAAHEKGVIHRDLKPANIKVTPDGKVKVLDFGLAKALTGETGEMILSDSPTLSAAATQQGVILGTAAYMSPEQARGKSVDKRTDVWAFGCVLYEMLAGQTVFQGEDVGEILASVIKGDAKPDLLPLNIPLRVRDVLNRCLQKDLKKRYRDIGDVNFEIEQVLVDPDSASSRPVAVAEAGMKQRTIFPWVSAAFILGLIAAGVAVWILKPVTLPDTRQVTRFYYEMPEDHEFSDLTQSNLAASPDGSQFAYSTSEGIYLRSMHEISAKLIAGTVEKTQQPFFSPDGEWIGYWSQDDSQLKKININGGTPIPLCDVPSLGYLDWSIQAMPQISPDGEWIAYVSDESGQLEVYVRPFPEIDKERLQVSTDGGNSPLWSPSGKNLFYRNDEFVMAVEVETKPEIRAGKPKMLFQGAYHYGNFYQANQYDIHPDGKRFLMIKEAESADAEFSAEGPCKINVVLNWFEELKKKVPVD